MTALHPVYLAIYPSYVYGVDWPRHGRQARRQEMKWGGVFSVKKVENWGLLFVKGGPFLNAGCIMYGISIFYFTFFLLEGAYAPCLWT